jgi:hypothetical protein
VADHEHDKDRKPERPPGLRSLDPVEAYHRRTRKIREEIARNRRGEYAVPTWVLALALVLVVAVWIVVLFVI